MQKFYLIAATLLCLAGCATPLHPPPKTLAPQIPISLAPCQALAGNPPTTYGELADSYIDAVAWGASCRRRAQALEAAWPRP